MQKIASLFTSPKKPLGLTFVLPVLLLVMGFGLAVQQAVAPQQAVAAETRVCKTGEVPGPDNPCIAGNIESKPESAYTQAQNAQACNNGDCTGLITKYVKPLVILLSALVGIVATGSIIYAGIQYSSAKDEASKVNAAKDRIGKTIVALIVWLFMLTILQWLLPGGVF